MKDILVYGGGLDTELAKCLGKSVKEVTEGPLWCSRHLKENRDACVQVCRSYIRAGSDIVSTPNYQGTVEGFKKHLNLTEDESIELLKDSVYIVKDAIKQELGENENGRKVLICGILGPYGASLNDGSEYNGEYIDATPLETIKNVHKPILDALVTGGVDIMLCATIPAIAEAELMLTLIKDYPQLKVIMSFSCKDDQHITHGETLADAIEHCYKVNAAQLVAVGVNCVHPTWVTPLLRSVRERLPDVGFMVRCNSGETYDPDLKEYVGKEKCVPLTNYVQDWIDLGANYIGGCCRTSPEDTKRFRQYIDKLKA